jgi:precorrin-2/cobalt-factor-2 C20-methyltransferase
MTGKLYSIGVGPGDPELLTLKAAKILRTCEVLAVPESGNGMQTAKDIVSQAVDLTGKRILKLSVPMTKDQQVLEEAHRQAVVKLESELEQGKDVALITLGCPTIYASCIYLHRLVLQDGYQAEIIPGVPSFCAAAARLNTALCEGAEPLIILPAAYPDWENFLDGPGNKVLMKSASHLGKIRDELNALSLLNHAVMVERCGMKSEKIYRDLRQVGPENSYFSLILVKERKLES